MIDSEIRPERRTSSVVPNTVWRNRHASRRQTQIDSMCVLEEVGLAGRARDSVAILSGGMQRRLNLACGLVHRPDLLLLDEPTVGVDPQSRAQILETIQRAADAGAAVVYSTHYMEEVERICSRALLLDRGKAVTTGTITELIALGGCHPVIELTFEGAAPRDWCDGLAGIRQIGVPSASGKVGLQIESFALVNPILARARMAGARVREFSVRAQNLSVLNDSANFLHRSTTKRRSSCIARQNGAGELALERAHIPSELWKAEVNRSMQLPETARKVFLQPVAQPG